MVAMSSRIGAIVCLNLLASTALAAESVVYSYDALGRLITTTVTGGPSGGVRTSTVFDKAGNRSSYAVTGGQPSAPTFSVSDATVNEGSAVAVTVTRSGPKAGTDTVQFSTADGAAVANVNYFPTSGAISFAPGETTKTFSVSTIDDQINTTTKALSVNLSSPSNGAAIGRSSGTVSIVDIDYAPTLAIGNTTVTEGGAAVFTVTRAGATGSPVTVNYATGNGSASAPGDYTATTGTLSFAAGETSKNISVPTVDDSIYEIAETFWVRLSAASGATISSATGTATISDADAPPVFSIANVAVNEGAGSATLTVTKTGATTQISTVNYATGDGTATASSDYTATSGTLTFAAGVASKTFSVPIVNDTTYEPTESFSVGLSGASTATISPSSGAASVTINDNDALPSFKITSGGSVAEGGIATFTITKTGSTTVQTSVNYATANGSATAPTFYDAVSGVATFAPTDTAKTINVHTIASDYYDGTTNFSMNLSNPSTATISNASAIANITDNTAAPTFSLGANTSTTNQVSVTEGSSFTFNVFLSGYVRNPLTINYATSNGTATAGSDFAATSGTLSIGGYSSGSFTVPTIDDTAIEGNQSFYVSISSPSAGTLVQSKMTATIIDNDFSVANPVANPDDAGTVKFCGEIVINPVLNDTDPGGLYPLTLLTTSFGGFQTYVTGNEITLVKTPGGTAGTKVLPYTIRNSGGATATGNITVRVAGSSCDINSKQSSDSPESSREADSNQPADTSTAGSSHE